MTPWIERTETPTDVDVEVLEESALAMAQSTIQNAIDEAQISRAELARKMGRPRSFVSLMLKGTHNLTIKTMSRALAACGFEIRFQHVPIIWNWKTQVVVQPDEEQLLPAQAGSTKPVSHETAGLVVDACHPNYFQGV